MLVKKYNFLISNKKFIKIKKFLLYIIKLFYKQRNIKKNKTK